jgi:hypothetical protein
VTITRPRQVVKRFLPWLVVLYVALLLSPVEYGVTRLLIVLGAALVWGATLFVSWPHRWVRIAVLAVLGLVVILVALPGRQPEPAGLRADYRRGLSIYGHTRYWWGGETPVGIDCSGLVREGLVWGQLLNGVRTLNGTPIRSALSLWWYDCGVGALRDGYRGMTHPVARYASINDIDGRAIAVGDLAVTGDGSHVLVYVGKDEWMQADPFARRVITVTAPSDNRWFAMPVLVVRWDALGE